MVVLESCMMIHLLQFIYVGLFVPFQAIALILPCGIGEPPPELIAAHQTFAEQDSTGSFRSERQTLPAIDLYVHIVETTQKVGQITNELVSKQLEVITSSFSKYDISFNYRGSDRTVNDNWALGLDDTAMKRALRKGDYLALNLFIQNIIRGAHGICTFPQGSIPKQLNLSATDAASTASLDYRAIDGCQIASYTMPRQFLPVSEDVNAQSQAKQDVQFKGLTAIHELGHWFGLLHTFQGQSCSEPGDFIADTRQQSNYTTDCPLSRISCPDLPHLQPSEDPIHNYMDYSGDLCWNEFTPLQVRRIVDLCYLFRKSENTNPTSTSALISSISSKKVSNLTITSSVGRLPSFSESPKNDMPKITIPGNPIPNSPSHVDVYSQPSSQNDYDGLTSPEYCPGQVSCSEPDEVPVPKPAQNLPFSESDLDVSKGQSSAGLSLIFETPGASEQRISPTTKEPKAPNIHSVPIVPIGSRSSVNPSLSTELTSPTSPSFSSTPTPQPDKGWNHTVTAYFGSGNTDIFPPSKIPWDSITHLCYAFGKTQNASANWSVSVNDTLLRTLSKEAIEHKVDLLLSVGGYGEGGRYFSDIVHTNASINAFVSSFKNMVQKYRLAGIDIDWEFVGGIPEEYGGNRPTDAKGYLQLLKALRAAMPQLQITAAVPMHVFISGGNATGGAAYADMRPFVPYFDRLNLMLYDLWNGEDTAGANAPLGPVKPDTLLDKSDFVLENPSDDYPYVNAGVNPDQDFGISGVHTWRDAGFPIEKLIYGVPFYGYGYDLLNASSPSNTGLYSNTSSKSSGDSNESPSGSSGFWKWRNLKSQGVVVQGAEGSYEPGPGWQHGYDSVGKTPYVWSVNRSEIISYDDPQSLRVKYDWARSQGMGGMMFWAMYGDTDDGELTKVLV